ncbi:DNA gyrase subunit B [Streptomyces racemochromogenes]|uniref:DNA topoisomerase (ATP-hydrolyzing) n=1 Tax=Streptomyces racemochromogenes TaxID=67353 RepID=A0ABW7P862_9ACTN
MSEERTAYDASRIQVLDPREAIRRRPGMYVGSCDERGLHRQLFELCGEGVNEVLAGRADRVDVTLAPEGWVRIAVDGPRVPPDDRAGDCGGPGLEALLADLDANPPLRSRNAVELSSFGSRMGPFVANALSSRLTAEFGRGQTRRVHRYERGYAVGPETTPDGPRSQDGPRADDGREAAPGTLITFRPDTDVFGTAEHSFDVLAERFRELAYLNPGLDIHLSDRRSVDWARSERFRFPGGARDFVAFLAGRRTPGSFHGRVHGLALEEPRMSGSVEVALSWDSAPGEEVRSFANSCPTPWGGTHVEGFRAGLAAAVNAFARERGLLTPTAPDLDAGRVSGGLTAVVSVKLDRVELTGSTRGALANEDVLAPVAQAVREHLRTWLAEDPQLAATVAARVATARNAHGDCPADRLTR